MYIGSRRFNVHTCAHMCVLLNLDHNILQLLITGSLDEVFYLRMWTINGSLVKRVCSKVQIKCLQYTSAPEGVYVNVLVGGLANGNIK